MNIFICTSLTVCIVFLVVEARVSIPEPLIECYDDKILQDTRLLPANLRILLDILRKAERYSRATMDTRIFASSLLRRFKLDGIEYLYDGKMKDTIDGIIPYAATGLQRNKHKLTEQLVPGDDRVFPSDALSLLERCLLHRIISNAIYQLPSNSSKYFVSPRTNNEASMMIENGIMKTAYGTIAPGTFIGALAAVLQRQIVPLQLLHPVSLFANVSAEIDNVWLTTLAGDLAEVSVQQGPLDPPMVIGISGIWDNETWPSLYKLRAPKNSSVPEQRFGATQAEIIAGIDGLIVAYNALNWHQQIRSLRLSQILDAYYSTNGLNLDDVSSESAIRACDRRHNFERIVPRSVLYEQTLAISRVLAFRAGAADAHITDEALERMVSTAVRTFMEQTEGYFYQNTSCQRVNRFPRVEAILLLVGDWTDQRAMKILAAFMEELDVSLYGSKIGIIDGANNEWLLNVTDSPMMAYHAIYNRYLSHSSTITDYSKLNFTGMLEKVCRYLDERWERNKKQRVMGNLGQAIVTLFSSDIMIEKVQSSALLVLKRIKHNHPDVNFRYCSSKSENVHLLQSFVMSEEDGVINSIDPSDIAKHLYEVPTALRPPSRGNISSNFDEQFEDYTRDSELVTYKIHSDWRLHTRALRVTIHGFGYGAIQICSSNRCNATSSKVEISQCRLLSGHDEVNFVDYSECTMKDPCPTTYFHVRQMSTLRKCTELDCKYPTQVRYIIRIQNQHHWNISCASFSLSSNFSFLFLIVAILQSFYLRI